MQLTLVSHYGEKPVEFERPITDLQKSLSAALPKCFHPYHMEQVHGTLVGLEGTCTAAGTRDENFFGNRGETKFIDFAGLLDFLRESFEGFEIRVGGFDADTDYGFSSRGLHPFFRSFSFQDELAVCMGWPADRGGFLPALEDFRRRVETFGILHKWHRLPADRDNDFFFVLGRIDGMISEKVLRKIEHEFRVRLAQGTPVRLRVSPETISFVAYRDTQLPLESSRMLRVTNPDLNASLLSAIYDE